MVVKALLPLVLFSVLAGCASAPSPQVEASSRVKPIVVALKAYHHDTGDYPKQLDDLRPHYIRTDVIFFDHTDAKQTWVCLYHRIDRDNYSLGLYSGPCSEALFDKEGRFIAGYGPNYK